MQAIDSRYRINNIICRCFQIIYPSIHPPIYVYSRRTIENNKNNLKIPIPITNTNKTMAPTKVVIVYGGELAKDVAEQIDAQKPASGEVDVTLRCASERPKTLLDSEKDTVLCFVMQTIENEGPTEEGSAVLRFFKRKTHPSDLLNGNDNEKSLRFAVLGLGDSNLLLDRQTTAAKDCNQVAQQLDARLEALGGTRSCALGMADERTELTEVEPWISAFWKSLV